MFTRQKSLFRFTKVIPLIILFCFTFSSQKQIEGAVKAKDLTEIKAQTREELEEGFLAYITELFGKLKVRFENRKFDEMAALLGDNTILITPQADILIGEGSLKRFWREEKDKGVTDVDFSLKNFYVSKVEDPIEQVPDEDTIVHVGHAIIKYRLKKEKKEGVLTNKTGTLTLSARHPKNCVWQP